jgi:hypothetical protein
MANPLTVGEVFETAIATERSFEDLYNQMQIAFAQLPDMAQFWGRFSSDEARHATWLSGLRARLDRDVLSKPVSEEIVRLVRGVADFSADRAMSQVSDLEDAFELANELENAETNAIFQFLIQNFEPDAQMQAFLRTQLDKHIGALMYAVPPAYKDPVIRKALKISA